MTQLKRSLGLLDLVLFNIVAIVGLRWLATAARTGPSSIVLWVLAFLGFFIPSAIAVVILSTRFPEEGGIYVWTKHAFGEFHGFLCGWCYWMSNLSYFPTLLVTSATIGLYAAGSSYLSLKDSPKYLFIFTICALSLAIAVNVIGLDIGKWLQNIGSMGNWIPAAVVITFGAIALVKYGSASNFSYSALLPHFYDADRHQLDLGRITFWSTMCFGFAGLELASIMGGEIKDPRRNVPRAVLIAGVGITLIYILGTSSILVALPAERLSVISAVPQAVADVGSKLGFPAAARIVGGLIAVAGIGGTCAWFAGSARLPFVAGLDRYLPPAFGRLHPRFRTPYVSILVQGGLSVLLMVMATLGSTTKLGGIPIEEIYIILVDMSIIIYFIPFLYLFASLIKLKHGDLAHGSLPRALSGGAGRIAAGVFGLLTTIMSIALACVPADEVANKKLFFAKVVGGCLLFTLLGAVVFLLGVQKFHDQTPRSQPAIGI